MSFYLRLKNHPEDSKFIFFEYLEEIPDGGWVMTLQRLLV